MFGKRRRDQQGNHNAFQRSKYPRSSTDASVSHAKGRFRHRSNASNNRNSHMRYYEQNQDLMIIPPNGDDPSDILTIRNGQLDAIVEEHSAWIETENAQTVLKTVTNDISNIIKKNISPKYIVHPFGSYITRLGFITSDIDFYLERPKDCTVKDMTLLNRLKKSFDHNPKFARVIKIASAKIPLLKCIHKYTQKECDISFVNEIGVRNTYLMQLYICMNANLRPMTMFLKYLLKKYNLHGVGKITTYMIFWLVVFYMQQRQLLPAVSVIREAVSEDYVVRGWDCRVPDFFQEDTVDDASMLDHVKEFFIFYDQFSFLKKVIAPYAGCAIEVNDFERLHLNPNHYSTYLDKVASRSEITFATSYINLQDPSEHCVNTTKQVTLESANKFRLFCNFFRYIFTNVVLAAEYLSTPLHEILPDTIPPTPADGCQQNLTISINRFKYLSNNKFADTFPKDGVRYVLHVLEALLQNKMKCTIELWTSNDVTKITRPKGATELLTEKVTIGNICCKSQSNDWLSFIDPAAQPTNEMFSASFKVFAANNIDVGVLIEGPNTFVKYMSNTFLSSVLNPQVFFTDSD